MIISILGAGSVALANACWLAKEGHDVRVWSALKEERAELAGAGVLTYDGIANGTTKISAPESAQECLKGAEVVMIAAPAFAHDELIAVAAPYLKSEQLVVFHPVTGMSSLLLSKVLSARGVVPLISDLSTSLFTARRRGGTSVWLLKIKDSIDVATLPAVRGNEAVSILASLFGDRFRLETNVLAISLNNHNPIYHVGPLLCNLSRVEREESTIFWDWITPGVAQFVRLLDDERLKVVRHYGTTEVSVDDYFKEAHGIDAASLPEVFPAMSRKLGGPIGPHGFNHRFVVEDVPFGLVFFWSLGQMAGIDMPSTKSTIQLTSAIWQRDFLAEGRTVERLGLAGMGSKEFSQIIERGFA